MSTISSLRNRLKKRFHNYRIARYILYLTVFWLVSLFLAPLSLPPHTVENLDGRANWVDYSGKWGEMAHYNPYAAAVYFFGDFNCHQKSSRSLYFHDNQLPVCARDTGTAFGLVVGALGLFFVIRTPYLFPTFLSLVPGRIRGPLLRHLSPGAASVLIAFLFLLPTGFDGFYQLLTSYESTNPVRLVTGFFLGVILAWGFGAAFLSVTTPFPPYYPYYSPPPNSPSFSSTDSSSPSNSPHFPSTAPHSHPAPSSRPTEKNPGKEGAKKP